ARGAVEIDMKAKGLSVTEYLMRRAAEVVTKADILEHVWDFGFDGDPNVVEVHVSALRRKTDKPFATQSIQTARGAGYKLVGASG
ncbi:MAG: winged helix-turn-helix domain-containing protein, partial [Acidimicrobiales bacterium]